MPDLRDPRAAFIDAALWHGPLEDADAILQQHPDLAGSDIHVAAILGDDAAVRRFLELDPTSAILQGFPLTLHPSDWYFSRTVMGLALCAGLMVYAFHTSLGGKPAFGEGK